MVTSYVVTVTAIETVITVGGTDMGAAGGAGSGSSTLVLPSAVESILSSLVLADSTFGEIEALNLSLSNLCLTFPSRNIHDVVGIAIPII